MCCSFSWGRRGADRSKPNQKPRTTYALYPGKRLHRSLRIFTRPTSLRSLRQPSRSSKWAIPSCHSSSSCISQLGARFSQEPIPTQQRFSSTIAMRGWFQWATQRRPSTSSGSFWVTRIGSSDWDALVENKQQGSPGIAEPQRSTPSSRNAWQGILPHLRRDHGRPLHVRRTASNGSPPVSRPVSGFTDNRGE